MVGPPATSPYPAQAKPVDPYVAKRRTANHPCPVCGKHYVNEGSLRKHLACHPETQLTSGLRMWPCSVCQAVFTHESGRFYVVLDVELGIKATTVGRKKLFFFLHLCLL